MSTSGQDGQFAAGFMDDYFAEADEHMVAVRRSLLNLEGSLGSSPPMAVLEDLFRSFHSLKGISAMVELREAEQLAHLMESGLRAVRQGALVLTSESFEVLVDGVRMLESVIAARRASAAVPSIEPLVERIEALLRRAGGAANSHQQVSDTHSPASSQPAAGAPLWRVTFVPSPQLVERGVKVDTVRARLLEIGQVLNVAPKVLAGGGISFEFDVQTEDEARLEQWRGDGLSYERLPDAARTGQMETASATERPLWDIAAAGSTNVVRVDLARLDDLMRLVGDMVVTRSRLEDTL